MDKTSLEILDNHVQEINKSVDPKDANDILLKTIKLLLDNVDYSDDVLATYSDEKKMQQFISSFGRAAQSACDFYQASKDHLDPAVLNSKIGQKLEAATQEVTRVNALMENIEKSEAELLKEEKELNEKKDACEELEKKVYRLKEIKEKITVEALNELKNEEAELDLHLGENSKIANKLKEYGVSSVDGFLNEIERRKNIVKTELEWFDKVLKGIIAEQEGEINH